MRVVRRKRLDVQLRLQRTDLVRYRGLGDIQLLSRAGKIQVFRNSQKAAQLESIQRGFLLLLLLN